MAMLHRPFTSVLLMSSVLALTATWANADTLAIRSSGTGAALTIQGKVTKVDGGQIFFLTESGHETSRDVSQVFSIQLDDDPVFSAAETDFVAGNFDKALTGYEHTVKTTDKGWLQDWCAARMSDAAGKTGRFDIAVTAYLVMMKKDPTTAAGHKPAIPPDSSYLDAAAQSVTAAASASGITPQVQQSLLGFLLDIQRARKDTKAIADISARLGQLSGNNADTNSQSDPGLAQADAKLALAKAALDQKNYDQAINEIEGSKGAFIDPSRQVEALFTVAQAKEGIAQTKNDADSWKDAALAYMRVYVNFKDAPNTPHVAESLMKVATILETLKDPKALETYQSVVSQFKDSPVADAAQKAVDRLKSADH